jgi:hypothetical protein
MHAHKSTVKKENGGQGEEIKKFVIFILASCERTENFDFHLVLRGWYQIYKLLHGHDFFYVFFMNY